MTRLRASAAAAVLLAAAGAARAGTIDFSHVDSYAGSGYDTRIGRIDDVTFSSSLFTQSDGFHWDTDFGSQAASPWYGEQGEFFTFDSAVTLVSVDFRDLSFISSALPVPAPLYVDLFDASNGLLSTTTVNLASTFQTVSFGTADVSKVVLRFGGGTNFYGDGRSHAWYEIDNITSTTNAVPLPSAAWTGLGMLAALGVLRGVRPRRLAGCP